MKQVNEMGILCNETIKCNVLMMSWNKQMQWFYDVMKQANAMVILCHEASKCNGYIMQWNKQIQWLYLLHYVNALIYYKTSKHSIYIDMYA